VVASICIDNNDFKVDPVNGRLELNHHFVQNNVETFAPHVLNGAQDVFEKIVAFDDVVIPVDGYYIVTMDARGNATITSASPGTIVAASVSAQLRVNNVAVAGTETMLITNSQGSSTVDQPALQLHGTGSCTRTLFLTAGQALSLWGKRNADPGTTTSILSDDDGRCRITATRISGV
jgi:hypothetical protein